MLVSFRKAGVGTLRTRWHFVRFSKTNIRTAVGTAVTTLAGFFAGMIIISHMSDLLLRY